jgi:hypothetical protein
MADTKRWLLKEVGALRAEVKSLKILMNPPEPNVQNKPQI